jgi:hypothetical protein
MHTWSRDVNYATRSILYQQDVCDGRFHGHRSHPLFNKPRQAANLSEEGIQSLTVTILQLRIQYLNSPVGKSDLQRSVAEFGRTGVAWKDADQDDAMSCNSGRRKFIISFIKCCDVTAESRNIEARDRCPMLSNGWKSRSRIAANMSLPGNKLQTLINETVAWEWMHGFPRQRIRETHNWKAVISIQFSRRYERRGICQTEQPPCAGGDEYHHRDPASRRRRLKGKSQI